MSPDVAIFGGGIAAEACAKLLGDAGLSLAWSVSSRPLQPTVLLGDTTLRLLDDVFPGLSIAQDLVPVRRRIVQWGASGTSEISHVAAVATDELLLRRLQSKWNPLAESASPAWSIHAGRRTSGSVVHKSFGAQQAEAFAITLKPGTPQDACWIEALETGWLFLLPEGGVRGRLLAVGDVGAEEARTSSLIAPLLERIEEPGKLFPAFPKLTLPLCGDRWLALGSAALSFDPICGEGVGHSLREAILAAAVVRAAVAGRDTKSLLEHYRVRLISGMARHLQTCLGFYQSGNRGPWWDRQEAAVREGIEWCGTQLAGAPRPQFRLNDFTLEPLAR